MSPTTIGAVSLNISFVLYLVHYLPQLIHNQRQNRLAQMSLGFHYLLVLSYISDLNYGYGLGLPWQYRLVSIIGLCCVLIQHAQLAKLYQSLINFKIMTCVFFVLLLLSVIAISTHFPAAYYLVMGYMAQVAGLFYFMPQIIKNYRSGTVMALSLSFLVLDLICYACDNVSAWALNWPMPSKIGALMSLLLITVLIIQRLAADNNVVIAIPNNTVN